MNNIVEEDLDRIFNTITDEERAKFNGSRILLTGFAGFVGFYLTNFLIKYAGTLGIEKVIGLDNFKVGHPKWIKDLEKNNKFECIKFDIINDSIEDLKSTDNITHVFHMASIASPIFYRKYPIETLDANVWGLRKLLDFYKDKKLKGFVFFSSSEIYGDATEGNIPTDESYNGNVSPLGPRACYDEAKRFGETMCYLYREKFDMPITIIRPFNNYGPGMRLNDRRVPADFAKAVYENKDITIFSDGSPTRTFCYISDAVTGYLKSVLFGDFEVFNIGIETPEISIEALAQIYKNAGRDILGYNGNIVKSISVDKQYLTNNPNRRCPSIKKAQRLLGYNPQISVEEGVKRFLEFVKNSTMEGLEW